MISDSTTSEEQVTAQFLYGLRLGAIAVTTTILLSLSITRNPSVYRPLWVQVAVFTVLAGIVSIDAVMAFRRLSWGQARWWGVGITLTAAVASSATLPPSGAATSADWAYGALGWVGVIVLLERPLKELVGLLALIAAIDLCNLALTKGVEESSFLNFAASSIGTLGYPMAVGIAAATLRRVAKKAHTAYQQAAQIRTKEALAASLHQHRQRRFTALSRTALPLLRGLADGSFDPGDTDVQRACAVEAARMRRLFAEADGVPNKLFHELRHCTEVAERKGVTVDLQTQGISPDPPLEIRRALIEAPLTALSTATSWARVTLTATEELISVNTVSDSDLIDIPHPTEAAVRLDVFRDGQTLWVEAQWSTNLSSQ